MTFLMIWGLNVVCSKPQTEGNMVDQDTSHH